MYSLRSILFSLLTFGWVVYSQRIDTHFHALPPAYLDALAAAGGDPSGYPTPEWSLDAAIKSMKSIDTALGILSVSSPGVSIAGTGGAARTLARTLNKDLGNYVSKSKHRAKLGFFGVLPDFQDLNGTLTEIDYLYQEQRLCNGVTVFTSYGGKLLGHPDFAPIWARFQKYKALIFLHPSVLDVEPHLIGPAIPQPVIDYPLATTRAATDLVMAGRLQACPDIDIILSHAGGAVPYVGSRAINALAIPSIAKVANVNLVQAKKDFARFYYDVALSTSAAQLDGLLDFAASDKILFGSDFPYAPQYGIDAVLLEYNKYVKTNSRGSQVAPQVLRQNSIKLLNKHSQFRQYG
ncbi:Amidohydro-rel domain-containing protein [Fusarium keratoplasticum]|uniref:Amidohydro-rel domain-containing protein n=1 Tax=Fusarium keratoplasticum TaxID=1328300 RepID=A0ACC0RD62_9HYPO|nr:Amidohydro-rel domain-containing protein [Fusarium keratoplasticum]KAI8683375.1 Amidohydro-rel domain-containing protein [Fusarium keratoplasticum]